VVHEAAHQRVHGEPHVQVLAHPKVLPLTHALALMRYGLLGDGGAGLHDIWGMGDTTAMAALSLGVVALFAAALTALAIRAFSRSALR
jgi:hypothetical protein